MHRPSLKVMLYVAVVIALFVMSFGLFNLYDNKSSMQKEFEKTKQLIASQIPKETRDLFQKGIDQVAQQFNSKDYLTTGDSIPMFSLPNAFGKTVNISEKINNKFLILVWYMGDWCIYCNLYLKELQKRLLDFEQVNAEVIAISTQLPDKAQLMVNNNQLAFEVLSDVNGAVAEKFGILYQLPAEVREKYTQDLYNELDSYGNTDGTMPISATYVVNQEGKIIYHYIEADYTKRAEPDAIISAIKKVTDTKQNSSINDSAGDSSKVSLKE